MARYTFNELLHLLEQDGASYDEARRKLLQRAERFWDEICTAAAQHPDPVMRARLIGVIHSAKVPTAQKREAIEKLAQSENHEIPLRSIRYSLKVLDWE